MKNSLRKTERILLALAATLALLGTARAEIPSKLPKGLTAGPSVEGFHEFNLSNGMKAVLIPDPSKQTLTVNITYLVGSRHEGYGETGMAHLLEHLVFKGTPKHKDIAKELTERGARPNGTTWFDRTNYYETLPASEENLRWAIAFEADRMVNSFIARKDLDTEMTVVRNEFESGENSPQRVLSQRLYSTSYLWHNYGNATIGARSDIEYVPIERLQDFYRRYYQPDNAVLVVTGRFDEKKALELIAQHFGAIPKPKRKLFPTYTREPVQDGEREVSLQRVGDLQAIQIGYHVPAATHPDAIALEILELALGDEPSGRLHKALVEKGLATQVSTSNLMLAEPSLFTLGAELRPEMSLKKARAALLEVIDELAQKPIQESEITRARAKIIKSIDLTLADPERLAIALSEAIARGDWRLFLQYRDAIGKVTVDQVAKVAGSYLKTSNRTIGTFTPAPKPDRAEIPEAAPASQILADYKGSQGIQAGEAFDPSPEIIEKRTLRIPLSEDLRLILLPKKTRGATIEGRMIFNYGTVESLKGQYAPAVMMGAMLSRGTQSKSREAIADALDAYRSTLSVSSGAGSVSIAFQSRRENLADLLQLVAEILKEPSFPSSEFDQLKEQQLGALEQQRTDPRSVAGIAFARHFNPYPPGDIRYSPTLEERISAVKSTSLSDVRSFYKKFLSASHGDIALVGDFDADAVRTQIAALLGTWTSKEPYARISSVYANPEAVRRTFHTPDKPNAVYFIGQSMAITDENGDHPALTLANYLIGGGFLSSRLMVRIRQKEGLSYGVYSSYAADRFDPKALFSANAIFAPKNASKLEISIREELEKVIQEGFKADELKQGRDGYLQARQLSRAQDGGLASALATYSFEGRTYSWVAHFEEKIRKLTPGQVQEALKRRLDLTKMSIFKAGDFPDSTIEPASRTTQP